jgi:NADH dehydrogenase/NADH:ubiquinone oxidoreductase 75 kD subunit (chain G)
MPKIRINNIIVEAAAGSTILDAARIAGIYIPVLCHKDGVEHYSSCMVCMVKDKLKNDFIPSCSALVQEGMEIDASSDEVIRLRKKAVELLLSEHRAECEAPCRVVCPAGYDIPKMNRLLADGKIKEAVDLSLEGLDSAEIRCLTCPGYCENACRRKKIDLSVSIRNIQLFVFQNISKGDLPVLPGKDKGKNDSVRKRFSSRIGRLEESELKEWIKESTNDAPRFREINDFRVAGVEAESCMHCDCRSAGNCMLRDLAQEFSLKDPVGKVVNSPVTKKINYKTGLIFENAKCIKCGLCVRVCEDRNDEPALCFINRGFISIISEPLTEEFDTILATQSDKCIDVCPTGALGHFKD